MQLSKKQKTLAKFLAAFLKSASNCEYFEQKDDSHKLCSSKNGKSEGRG